MKYTRNIKKYVIYYKFTLQSAVKSGQEARIGQIDFSAAFDRVNRQSIFPISSALWVLEVLCCIY